MRFAGRHQRAGTLALHIEGNLSEYICRALGRIAYERDRPLEFSAHSVEQEEIVRRIDAVVESIPRIIAALPAAALDAAYSV